MSHEQSVTRKHGSKHVNKVGEGARGTPGADPPGTILKPLFDFEKPEYASMNEAERAASKRSETFGKFVDETMERHREADEMMGKPLPVGRIRREE